MQKSVRNVCAKFKVGALNRFRTGTHQVLTFPQRNSSNHENGKINFLWNTFQIKLSSVAFLLKSLTSNKSTIEQKSKYLSIHQGTRKRSEAVAPACNFIKKETLPQVFSCEFCEISKNTFSNRTPPVAATERWKIVKPITT